MNKFISFDVYFTNEYNTPQGLDDLFTFFSHLNINKDFDLMQVINKSIWNPYCCDKKFQAFFGKKKRVKIP